MTDISANEHQLGRNGTGEVAMSRLADRLAAMAPPIDLTPSQMTPTPLASKPLAPMPRPSPAVAAALATSAAISARAAERARRSQSVIGLTVDSFISACSFIPYALVALALRLTMARVFFLDGQTRVEGPHVPLNVPDLLQSLHLQAFDFSVVLPLQVKAQTFAEFLNYVALPVPPMLAAYLVSYAEFILPIMLVLGLGTRFAALGLLIMTALIQIYVVPDALWSAHIYWASMLLVLVSLGAGQISIDHIVRFVAKR